MDWSLPGSSVHGSLQAVILEWAAIPFCKGNILYCLSYQGRPHQCQEPITMETQRAQGREQVWEQAPDRSL